MTADGRTDTSGRDVDPWAPGGAMAPVPDAADDGIRLSFEAAEAAGSTRRPLDRRAWLVGGSVTLLAAVGLFAMLSDDDSLPEPGEAVDIDVEPFPEVTVELPRATPQATPPPLLADGPPASAAPLDPTERLVLAAAPREFVVDIAPELAEIFPTEIVALQAEEGLYEVSLPSGRVRVTDLGFFTGQTQLAANDQLAVLWPTPEGGAQIVTTDQAVGIPGGRVDRVSWSPSVNRMYLWAGRSFANGYEPVVIEVVAETPAVTWSPINWVDDVDDPAQLLDLDGRLLREDTGGTFSVGPDGAERLTTGTVIASGPNHLLLRECDAQRACGVVSVASDGERIAWPFDLPEDVVPQPLAGLSPGGDALLVIDIRLSADVPSELQVLELTDGSLQPLQASPIFEGFAAWDSNGSGVFYADRQLLYFDRFTGDSVVVSEDLPRLRSVRTRRPADSPICEVLEVALRRFAKMAAGGDDNSVGPPAPAVLDRVEALAPDQLRVDATTVADFVNNFISPDVADSQNAGNWPAEVTASLASLNSYAATGCAFATR